MAQISLKISAYVISELAFYMLDNMTSSDIYRRVQLRLWIRYTVRYGINMPQSLLSLATEFATVQICTANMPQSPTVRSIKIKDKEIKSTW